MIVSLAYSFVLSCSRLTLSLSRSRARPVSLAFSLSLFLAFSHYVSLLSLSLSFSLARSHRRPLLADRLCRARTSHRVYSSSQQTSPTPSTAPMRLRIDRCAQSPRGSRFVSRCPRQRTRRSPFANQQPPARTHERARVGYAGEVVRFVTRGGCTRGALG